MSQQAQRYRVVERIAAGGMAEVYRAESAGLEGFKKTVAIKRVLPHLSEKKQFIGMFLDEARLSAHLSHSNCVQVFDIGVGDNTYFIVMEFVDGSDLKAAIEYLSVRNRRMPLSCAVHICCRVCEGLAYAHEARDTRGRLLGVVHRDISPPNVLITRYGEVKVVDFGLAKANSQLEQSEPGIIKGKFSYLSPEAALGESVDLRTDIFAVGIILWELLAGQRLFVGETDLQTVRLVQSARIPDIRKINPEVSPELEAVLLRTLARDPRQRYQSARELCKDLNQILFQLGEPVSAFEVSEVIAEVIAEKDRKKAREKTSLIGTLIEDAMMEFTSLDNKGASNNSFKSLHSNTSSMASRPLDTFEDVQDWASDLGLDQPGAQHTTKGFAAGNLAALEDETAGRAMQARMPQLSITGVPPHVRTMGGNPMAGVGAGPASGRGGGFGPSSAPGQPPVFPGVAPPLPQGVPPLPVAAPPLSAPMASAPGTVQQQVAPASVAGAQAQLGGPKSLSSTKPGSAAGQKVPTQMIALGVALVAAAAAAGAYLSGLLH